jgi:hypothetical protein
MGPPRRSTGGKAPGPPYERFHGTTVWIDAERSDDSSRTDEDMVGIRAVMERLRSLFLQHGTEIALHEDTGDGWLALLDARTETVGALSIVSEHFPAALREHNASCSEGERLRLRVVVHDGKVAVDEQGATGHVPSYAARLLNSSKLRECLTLTTAPLVVCVSDQVFQNDVRQQPSRLPEGVVFVPIRISEPEKGFEAQAWVHAPGDVNFLARIMEQEAASAHDLAARAVPLESARRIDRGELAGRLAEIVCQAVRAPDELDRRVALVGKPGVGKRALVERVLADETVRGEFPDGITLVELGNRPDDRDLVAAQLRILEQLHEPLRPVVVDPEAGRERLRQALSVRKHLVVVDKLHRPEHLAAFPVPGSCALLAISDDERNLPPGVRQFPVRPLSAVEARRALATSAHAGDPATLPAAARTVAEACGNLPLGLGVAGPLVADGSVGWDGLAAELRAGARPRGQRRACELLLMRVVGASARRLPPLARACLWELGVFDGFFPVPRQVVERLWRRHGLGPDEVRTFLDLLVRRSLIRSELPDAVRMHDCLVRHAGEELAALGSATSLPELNGWIADSYLTDWGGLGGGLDRLGPQRRPSPDDRYGLRHLVPHLDRAGRTEQVHLLFEIPAHGAGTEVGRWHEVHTQAGELASFLADIGLAYRRAVEARATAAHDTDRMLACALRQARYDILRALLDSNGMPAAEDLATAAELGVIDRTRALSWIDDRIADPAMRARARLTFVRSCWHTLGGNDERMV